jgi:hypothetical protein
MVIASPQEETSKNLAQCSVPAFRVRFCPFGSFEQAPAIAASRL